MASGVNYGTEARSASTTRTVRPATRLGSLHPIRSAVDGLSTKYSFQYMRFKGMKPTYRDIEILVGIAKHQLLTTFQIALLYFPSVKTAKRRLKLFYDRGILGRFPRFSVGPGRSEYIYYLAKKGFDILETYGNTMSLNIEKRWAGSKNPVFVEHKLGISDFLVQLEISCRNNPGISCDFISQSHDHKKRNADLIPDAVFHIKNTSNKMILFFLEYDRGTEVIGSSMETCAGTIAKKIKQYTDIFDKKHYMEYKSIFNYDFKGFKTLFVTQSGERTANIIKIADELNAEQIIWATSSDQIKEKGLFGDIWSVAGFAGGLYSIVKSMKR